jgi:hypothetical protein
MNGIATQSPSKNVSQRPDRCNHRTGVLKGLVIQSSASRREQTPKQALFFSATIILLVNEDERFEGLGRVQRYR